MPIVQPDDDGDPMVRENFVLALFAKRPPAEVAGAVRRMIERWQALLPRGVPEYALVGADSSSFRKFGKATLARLDAELDPAALAGAKDLAHLRLQGPGELGPDWRFLCTLNRAAGDPDSPQTNLIELLFPPDAVGAFGAARLVGTLRELAGLVPFDSGYAGPGLTWCYDGTRTEAGEVIGPLALRHPGFDVSHNRATASQLGTRARGARWVTLLGPDLVAELGGADALRGRLSEAIRIEPAGAGIAIIAGPEPEIGDVNRKQDTPLLREVARAIEPVTFFGDRFLDVLLADDEEKRERWERRLLDGPPG